LLTYPTKEIIISTRQQEGNIFTAFADTAMYLYDNVAPFMLKKFGLNTAVVTVPLRGEQLQN
jgi:hypothetical protein